MGKFSQTFVAYHGQGDCYQDGTNKIVSKNRKCNQQTYNPFWKKPSDVRNRVETRAQLKIKTKASRNFQRRYQNWVNFYSKDSFTASDFDSDSDPDSNMSSDNESLASNASETEQNLLDEETNDKLMIDTKSEVVNSNSPESLASNITIYTFSIKNSKNQQKQQTTNNSSYLSPQHCNKL